MRSSRRCATSFAPIGPRSRVVADLLRVGSPPIDVRLRTNTRAKRLILRVGRDGPVLTLPSGIKASAAREFLEGNECWLRDRLARTPAPELVGLGCVFPFEGNGLTVRQGKGPARVVGDDLLVGGAADKVPAKVATFVKTHARRRLCEASDQYSAQIGEKYQRITLRDPKSRWGSCSSTGNLMYSWRLAMAPPEVLDYVAAHEVAHLVEFNHSRYFWRLVDELCPDYPYHRSWLKENGSGLHAYRFDP